MNLSIKQQFKQSIRCGTGKAYLLMQKYPHINFSKYIIDTSIYNYAYDTQSGDRRCFYLYRLINLAFNKEFIVEEILKALVSNIMH